MKNIKLTYLRKLKLKKVTLKMILTKKLKGLENIKILITKTMGSVLRKKHAILNIFILKSNDCKSIYNCEKIGFITISRIKFNNHINNILK